MQNLEWLNEFSKEEIVLWLEQCVFIYINPPRKSDFLFMRWQILSKKLLEKEQLLTEELNKIDGKKRDELAKQFNNEKNQEKQLKILEKIKPYDDAFQEYVKKSRELAKERKKINELYNSIKFAREEEET